MRVYTFQSVDCQKLETFQKMKHHLEEVMARKKGIDFEYHPDFKDMIVNPIAKWDEEATASIELGTNKLLDSFQVTREDIQKATDRVKVNIEIDRNTKKK